MKRLLKVKIAWFPVWCTAFLMLCMLSIYLPVFGGQSQRLTDFPLIVVNEDQGAASVNMGQKIMDNLIQTQDGHSFKWTIESSRERAVEQIKNNKAYGALVIPADYSASLSGVQKSLMTGQTGGKPARMEILVNEAGGQLASSVAITALQTVASTVNAGVSQQIKAGMTKLGLEVSPQAATLLDNPVQAKTTNALGLTGNINKGMTPFVVVMISSISGLLGVNMIHGYVEKIAENMRRKGHRLSHAKQLLTEILLGVITSVLVTSVIMIFIFGVFDSAHTTAVWRIYLFLLLSSLTMFFLFKMLSLFLGKWGMLAMFPVNIMGIFGSGGAFPVTTLPEFHRALSSFLPTRYMVDGFRALFYYGGHMEAGLGTALQYIVTYLIMFLFLCGAKVIMAHHQDKKGAAAEAVQETSASKGNEMGALAAE